MRVDDETVVKQMKSATSELYQCNGTLDVKTQFFFFFLNSFPHSVDDTAGIR